MATSRGENLQSPLIKLSSLRELAEERLRSYSPYLHYKLTHNLKPLNQLLDLRRITIPKSFADLKERTTNNFIYFSGNYIIIAGFVSIAVLVFTNIYLFLSFVVFGAGLIYVKSLDVDQIEISLLERQFVLTKRSLYLSLTLLMIPVVVFTGPISTLLEMISYSLVVIGLHSCLVEGYRSETSFNESVV